MNTFPIKDENPEGVIHLHKRLGEWVIDVTVKKLNQTIEIHKETSYQRAVGVYWFLHDSPFIMYREAERLIGQRNYDRGNNRMTIEEELARR